MRIIFLIVFFVLSVNCFSQNEVFTVKQKRISVLNPGIEYEFPLTARSLLSSQIGCGIGFPYYSLDQTGRGNGFVFNISPFLDVEYKFLYNINKRSTKQKNTKRNSANYIGVRQLTRGFEIAEYNFYKPNNFDFAIAPVWGLQRSSDQYYYLFDVGIGYVFDKNNSGAVFLIQFNLGLNID